MHEDSFFWDMDSPEYCSVLGPGLMHLNTTVMEPGHAWRQFSSWDLDSPEHSAVLGIVHTSAGGHPDTLGVELCKAVTVIYLNNNPLYVGCRNV